jgi:hypothetical protein
MLRFSNLRIESLFKLNKPIIPLEHLISSDFASLLHKIVKIKNEIVIMKLHFRYHGHIIINKIKILNKYYKYCQD